MDFAILCLFIGYSRLWQRCRFRGLQHLPEGPVIVMSNHTCSADPAFLVAATRRPPGFLFAEEYFLMPVVNRLFRHIRCIPVRRNGRDVGALRQALRQLSEGLLVVIFPEGGLYNAGRGMPRRGKSGAAWIALRSKAPILPVLIEGGPQTSDVAGAWLRPFQPAVRVSFGPPVDLSDYLDRPVTRKAVEQVMTRLMESMWGLMDQKHRRCKSTSLYHERQLGYAGPGQEGCDTLGATQPVSPRGGGFTAKEE
jgi:1-acyl-sn-glycerol-3-phosphate acyltransferase